MLRWCTLPAFGASSYIPSIVLERGLFIRERNDGLYRVITYLCSKASSASIRYPSGCTDKSTCALAAGNARLLAYQIRSCSR